MGNPGLLEPLDDTGDLWKLLANRLTSAEKKGGLFAGIPSGKRWKDPPFLIGFCQISMGQNFYVANCKRLPDRGYPIIP